MTQEWHATDLNAVIKSARISSADHGILSAWLSLDYGGSQQGFGGYQLYSPHVENTPNIAGHFIWRVLETVGVSDWEHLHGKTIRVRKEDGCITEIGHIVKDKWFNPRKELKALEDDQNLLLGRI